MKDIQGLIKKFDLKPHPEGGYFRETYRSEGTVEIQNEFWPNGAPRNYSTAILFLLTSDTFSAFHRIRQDELWHFYSGEALRIHIIGADGQYSKVDLGPGFDVGQTFQYAVPAGCWFAAEVINPDSYGLVGCTVAPGFDFEDFELADRSALQQRFPEHKQLISRLTRRST